MEKKIEIIDISNRESENNFGCFYNSCYQRFYRYAYYYVSNRQTAEDITHDAILYYWENRHDLPDDMDILGYILITIRNKCLNYLKHLKVETDYSKKYVHLQEWEVKARIMTLEETEYADIFSREIIDIITNSLAKLPHQTRHIFIENYFKNKSRKEIAGEMGVSLQKIDYHINKANNYLYDELKDYFPILLFFFNYF